MANGILSPDDQRSDGQFQEMSVPLDIAAEYRRILGRAPDARELESEQENLERYGPEWAAQLTRNLTDRAGSTAHRQFDSQSAQGNQRYGSGTGNLTNRPGGSMQARLALPGLQFDDAYTNLLERIAQAQIGEVRSNPGLDQLTSFLNSRFSDLSESPGYSPAETALLRTQAFEPVEANRRASAQRATERAAARGFAPSSGLMELDLRDIDQSADRTRALLDRDLSIAGLSRRDADLNQAQQIAQALGLSIPQSQRAEEAALGNLLYQLPRTALQDAMGVVNGSPSSGDALTQALQLLQATQRSQGMNDAQNAALWGQIGQILANLPWGR